MRAKLLVLLAFVVLITLISMFLPSAPRSVFAQQPAAQGQQEQGQGKQAGGGRGGG